MQSIKNKAVIDAKVPVDLIITRDDVKQGKIKNQDQCAAALACLRQFHCDFAIVHISRVYIQREDHWERYATPRSLRSEIIAFDRGGQFMPGIHRLGILPISQQTNGKMQGTLHKQHRRNSNAKPRKYVKIKGVRRQMAAKGR